MGPAQIDELSRRHFPVKTTYWQGDCSVRGWQNLMPLCVGHAAHGRSRSAIGEAFGLADDIQVHEVAPGADQSEEEIAGAS